MKIQTEVAKRTYPWTTTLAKRQVTLRVMRPDEAELLLAFAQSLPEKDLLFLSIDITKPAAAEAWARSIGNGHTHTLFAEVDGRVIGHGTLAHNDLLWTRHLGEIQLLIDPEYRGIGLGHLLANEVFAIAKEYGLKKVVARMAADQRGALQVFEQLGFYAEALLADYVMDREGRTHDLLVMSHDVTGLTR